MPTVMVVDDEPDFRWLVCLRFEQLGWRTVEAGNGEAALGLLATDVVDLVVTDLHMPRMDGLELRDRLAAERPGLTCVVWSGATARDGVEAKSARTAQVEALARLVDDGQEAHR